MTTLIRNGAVAKDDYDAIADDEALPAHGQVIVSWARWQKEGAALAAGPLCVGVRIPNTLDLAESAGQLVLRPLIALEFPTFSDGRAYSQARLLRDRYGYAGEIRATGASVVRDQLSGMARCGIGSFDLRADQDSQECLAAFSEFSLAYQLAADASIVAARVRSPK